MTSYKPKHLWKPHANNQRIEDYNYMYKFYVLRRVRFKKVTRKSIMTYLGQKQIVTRMKSIMLYSNK